MTEKRHSEFFTKKLISLINEGGGGGYMSSSRIAERVRSYIPLMDLPTRQQFPNQGHQRFLRYGVFYNEDNSELSIKHISSLIYDLGEWIKEDNDDSTGYNIIRNETTGLNVIQKQRKGKGIVTLHIFFPPHIGKERKNIIKEQIYIPESIKPAIYIHEQSNPHSLYGIVARMVGTTEAYIKHSITESLFHKFYHQ